MSNIVWNQVKERHMKGSSDLGELFIRFDKKGKVTAMYTLFGKTEKYLPDEEWMEDTLGAQLELDRIYNLEVFSRQLATK